jgi:diguanylate cyclase (GGDEF)-like protein
MMDLSMSMLSPRQRAWVIALAVLITAITLSTVPFAARPLGPNPVLFAALYSCFFTASAITALAFGLQHRSSGAFESGILGAAFGILAVIAPLYALASPGLGLTGLLGARPATSSRLWAIWHLAFLGCIAIYASRTPAELAPAGTSRRAAGRSATRRTVLIAALATLAASAIAWFGDVPAVFPASDRHGQWLETGATITLGVIVIVALLRRSGGGHMLDAWLALVVLVLISDAVVTSAGDEPFSLGWWIARCEHVTLSLAIVTVLLSQTDRTFTQALRAQLLLAEQAMVDGLTGIPNRRKFDRIAQEATAQSTRLREPLAFAMLDIDRFKLFNDEFGHLAGDECLRAVAHALRAALRREADVVARYGGEEFAFVLPQTDLAAAQALCQRVRAAVEALAIPHATTSLLQTVTVSIGVTVYRSGETVESVVARADEALYRAKANGRNRVEIETAGALAGSV